MKQTFLLICFLLFITWPALAQEEIGLNRPSIKWQQIETPIGRIIYPAGLDSAAFRLAGIMAYQQKQDAGLVGTGKARKVPVILQNQSVLPAGFSTPAPWRNEYYLTPPQNLFTGPVPWADYVTIHEYRHTQQFQAANQGFTLPYQVLMGETGWLLSALINQPLWFREGDAVAAETEYTKAGRGRVPRFHMETRALRLAGYTYDYEKANYPASFKDFVPNPYRTGYYMTHKLRQLKGDTIWNQVLQDTHRKHFFYAFNQSLKENAGLSAARLYNQTMAGLDSLWKPADKKLVLTKATVISKPGTDTYTNYRFPHYLPDGYVVALKDGLDEIRTFYKISADGKKEEALFPYGVYTEDHVMFGAAGNTFTWAESEFHERWRNEDYSVIKTYNIKTGQTKKLTSRTRFFAPSLSPDGTKIIAVETDKLSRSNLVILDAGSGTVLARKVLPFAGHVTLAQPCWLPDNRNVVVVVVSEIGNSLVRFHSEADTAALLVDFTTVRISRPFAHGQYIYFSAGFSGIDNIYAVHLSTRHLYQVTSVRFGAYEPAVSPDGRKLLYSSYTANGYRLEQTELSPAKWTRVNKRKLSPDLQYPLKKMAIPGKKDLTATTFNQQYEVKKYNALTDGLFNFYGWFPVAGNNMYGLDLSTRNLMSTLQGTIGAFYNTNEKTLGTKARLTYAAFYPVFDLEAGLRTRKKAEIREQDLNRVTDQEWTEKYATAGVRFPFRLTQGSYRSNLEIASGFGHYDVGFVDSLNNDGETARASFYTYRSSLTFSRLLPQARQHVKPRWGQTAQLSYQKAIDEKPERFLAGAALYFPGYKRTHSLNFRGAFKKEAVQQTYRFMDDFIMPRGYKPDPFAKMLVLSGNYELPVWYPDMAAGGVAFFQRLRTNFFYDYSSMQLPGKEDLHLNSAGAELLLDLRLLRLFSMTMGVRYSILSEKRLVETAPFQFVVTRFEFAN